jgi:hypothetical protein
VRSRTRRASAMASPVSDESPNVRAAAAMPLSSMPIRAGSHPPTVLTTLLAVSRPRIVPRWQGILNARKIATSSAPHQDLAARARPGLQKRLGTQPACGQ